MKIHDVNITPLKIISDERGKVMHMLRNDDSRKDAKNTGLLRNPANFQPLIPARTRNAVHVRTGFLDDVYQRKIHICTVHAMLEQSQASNCPETAQKRFLFRIPEDNLLSLVLTSNFMWTNYFWQT